MEEGTQKEYWVLSRGRGENLYFSPPRLYIYTHTHTYPTLISFKYLGVKLNTHLTPLICVRVSKGESFMWSDNHRSSDSIINGSPGWLSTSFWDPLDTSWYHAHLYYTILTLVITLWAWKTTKIWTQIWRILLIIDSFHGEFLLFWKFFGEKMWIFSKIFYQFCGVENWAQKIEKNKD